MQEITVRPNVLVLSYLFPNEVQPAYGIFVLNRLRAVQKKCNIKVIAPIQWYPLIRFVRGALWGSDIAYRANIDGMDVHHPRFPVIPRYMKWIDAFTYWWSVRGVAEKMMVNDAFHFDLIDVHWTYPDIVAGFFLARKRGKKFIVTVRGHEALYEHEKSLRRWLVAHFLRKADFVVTLSAELLDKVLTLGVAPEKARVVLNGVDLTHFRNMNRDECRLQLGLPVGPQIIISVGRLTEGKGHQDLVRMMPELSRSATVELYIVGGVNPEDDFSHVLRKMIFDLGLKNVHLVDKVPHELLPLWYSAADLFCLATRREGCPNVVLEALACGTPVVVTNVGAVAELVVEGENGFLVELEQISLLGGAVLSSLERKWDRKGIADGMTGWGWTACAEQVVDIYQMLLSRRQ